MHFLSIDFLIYLSISLLCYWFFIPEKWRSSFLLLCSLFFISSYSIKFTLYFLFNIILIYCAGNLIHKNSIKKKLILLLLIIWLTGHIIFFKVICLFLNNKFKNLYLSSFIENIGTSNILLPIGISYLIFRLIHYLVEAYRNNIPKVSFIDFALYMLFFPTFLAGPIERFEKFYPQTNGIGSLETSKFNYGLYRVLKGVIKKVFADNFIKLIMPILYSPEIYSRIFLMFSIYGLMLQLYMDFSGYADIAIGISRLFGYEIVENFNRPFFQKNIALFWRNWHISLYTWIRDYFFFPIFGHCVSNTKIYIGIFCTMLIFTLWHKISVNFFILGIYNGLGLLAWYVFQTFKKRYPLIQIWLSRKCLDLLMSFLTLSFVSFSLLLVIMRFDEAMRIVAYISGFKG